MKTRAQRKHTLTKKHGTLDQLWGRAVLAKAHGICVICGRPNSMNPHHFILKTRGKRYRWDIENGLCLCFMHHTGGLDAAHGGGLRFTDLIREKRPDLSEWYEKHRRLNETLGKYSPTLEDLEEIRDQLKGIIEAKP